MPVKRAYFSVERDGFSGGDDANPDGADRCMIALPGNDIDDHMAQTGAEWLMQRSCNVMTVRALSGEVGR